jgi:nickel transport system ATP-binding protein
MKALRGSAISMVMQNPMSCFDPVFSIESHFRETLRAHGVRGHRTMNEKIAAALAEVGFEDDPKIRHAYPFQLSGGMLQRIMLAIALMLDPELLIADEATSDLDTVAQARVLDLIDEARQRRRMGVLLVTHDFGVVARMADYVLVMEDGEVVERGPVASLFEHPAHDCTKALLAAHGKLSARMAEEECAV